MEARPQAGCVSAFVIGAWTHRASGSEKAFAINLSMATCASDMPLTALGFRPMAMRWCQVLQLYLCMG